MRDLKATRRARETTRVNGALGLVKPDAARLLPCSHQCGRILEILKGNTAKLRKLRIPRLLTKVRPVGFALFLERAKPFSGIGRA